MSRLDQFRQDDAREKEVERPQLSRAGGDDAGQLKALRMVGAFRVVDQKDLPAKHAQRLIRLGLVERKTLYPPEGVKPGQKPHELLTLSDKGREKLERNRPQGDRQRFWQGAVKPREAKHDLAIYRAYEKEAEEIERSGGRIERVVVDFEFKHEINRRMNALGSDGQPPSDELKSERRQQIAKDYDLPLIDDKVLMPDARIEFVDEHGQEQHRDIEVVTKAYRGAMMAAKKQSGFKLHNASDPRAAVRDDHHLRLWD